MHLRDLDNKHSNLDVVLIQTSSSKLQLFLEDKLKRKYNASRDTTFYIESKGDLKAVKQLYGVLPPMAERWFVRVDLDKINSKELVKLINESTTCIFVCTCSKYSIYKDFKSKIKVNIGDFYINYMRRPDLVYLYDSFVHSDNKLSAELFNFVVKSYSNDIDALFELFLALADGTKFESRKGVSEICGVGNLTVESFIFSLLKPLSVDVKRIIKNRVKYGADLQSILGYKTMYNFTNKSINTLIELKMLMINGMVYKRIQNLPDNYDEKALSRYQRYIWILRDIPMSRLLALKKSLGSRVWRSDLELLNFIYKYYEMEGRRYVFNSKSELQSSEAVQKQNS